MQRDMLYEHGNVQEPGLQACFLGRKRYHIKNRRDTVSGLGLNHSIVKAPITGTAEF